MITIDDEMILEFPSPNPNVDSLLKKAMQLSKSLDLVQDSIHSQLVGLTQQAFQIQFKPVRLDFFSYFIMSTITDIKSVLTQKNFDALCCKFHIPEEVHPQLSTPDQTIHDKPEGKIEGSPVCYTKPIDSLKNWNNRFFWVDSFTCPALFRWHTNKSVPKYPPPKPTNFNAEHYAMLVAHPAPFRKFPEVFLCLVGISRYYPLDEETYPSFRDENDEGGCWSLYIRVEGEAKLLETTVGRTVLLLPVALVRSEASLEDSVNRLFDEGGSGNQVDSAIGIDQNIVVEPEFKHVAAETEIVKKVTRHHKKRPATADASGSNHPPKKLKEDYGTFG
ncbi:hypothetical protein Tco_1084134 [Tanacetum coccineum]